MSLWGPHPFRPPHHLCGTVQGDVETKTHSLQIQNQQQTTKHDITKAHLGGPLSFIGISYMNIDEELLIGVEIIWRQLYQKAHPSIGDSSQTLETWSVCPVCRQHHRLESVLTQDFTRSQPFTVWLISASPRLFGLCLFQAAQLVWSHFQLSLLLILGKEGT